MIAVRHHPRVDRISQRGQHTPAETLPARRARTGHGGLGGEVDLIGRPRRTGTPARPPPPRATPTPNTPRPPPSSDRRWHSSPKSARMARFSPRPHGPPTDERGSAPIRTSMSNCRCPLVRTRSRSPRTRARPGMTHVARCHTGSVTASSNVGKVVSMSVRPVISNGLRTVCEDATSRSTTSRRFVLMRGLHEHRQDPLNRGNSPRSGRITSTRQSPICSSTTSRNAGASALSTSPLTDATTTSPVAPHGDVDVRGLFGHLTFLLYVIHPMSTRSHTGELSLARQPPGKRGETDPTSKEADMADVHRLPHPGRGELGLAAARVLPWCEQLRVLHPDSEPATRDSQREATRQTDLSELSGAEAVPEARVGSTGALRHLGWHG